jgi:hypothetical protein
VSIPAASPARPPFYADMLTGDSSRFTGGTGNWTNVGGTTSFYNADDWYSWPSNSIGSLQFVSTANGQYIECNVPGTFLANTQYVALFAITQIENVDTNVQFDFGVISTDQSSVVTPAFQNSGSWIGNVNGADTYGKWAVVAVRWIPTQTRTGVVLRMTRVATSTAGTHTFYLGHARVMRLPGQDMLPLLWQPATPLAPSAPASGRMLTIFPGSFKTSISAGKNAGSISLGDTGVTLSDVTGKHGLWCAEGNLGFGAYAEGTPGDFAETGYEWEIGDDFLSLYWGQRDADRIQLHSDADVGLQLRNRGTRGWSVSDDGNVDGKISDSFQWAFHKTGALTVATSVAEYWQTPAKCIIDEVRVHVGTAPTGAAILVDVNAGGTTIFTTQSNRPSIAAATTDATSGTADGGTSIAKNASLTIDVDQVGSTVAGSDLVVFVRGRLIW